MVNPSRRSVAPVRKLVAAVVGTIAVFVMLFGLGMSSFAIVALGAAMLALAIGLALVNVVRRGGRAWVAGTAHVVSASEPPASSDYGRCELQVVVAAAGLPASAVKIRDPRVPVVKWPDAGATLPVMVAVDDMRHVRIQWDEVMTHTEAMDEPPGYTDPLQDLPVDDLLPEPEAPPWLTRDRQGRQGTDTDEDSATADLTGQLGDLRERPTGAREAPGGPIVLEGTLVDAGSRPPALPRQPRPSPRPRPTTENIIKDTDTGNGGEANQANQANEANEASDNRIDEAVRSYPSARPGPSGAIHGIGITVLVTDLQRSAAFYRDMLGFLEVDNGDGSTVLASGDTRLVLRAVHDFDPESGRLIYLNLEVGDIEAVYEELRAKGVSFVHGPRAINRGDRLELRAASFHDPDGHNVAIAQWCAMA